jgi:zinc transport system substrate-binding protein
MKNIRLIALLLIVLFGAIFLLSSTKQKANMEVKKPIVAVTTFALYDIVKHIAQDSVEIVNILPFGVDPHSFEPTPRIMAKIEKSSLIIYSGAGLEPWTEGFNFPAKALNVSKYVKLRHLKKDEKHSKNEHHHEGIDPHYWLDFENMKKATQIITKVLIQTFPHYEALYKKNEKSYLIMLDNLEKKYKEELSSCRLHTVVVSHNALGYLAQNYGFSVESLSGLSPEAQPSAKDVTRLMADISKDGIKRIFFEHFVNDNVIKRVAEDMNIALDVFQPLGNITKDEADAGLSYEDIMLQNLQKLKKALECK